jgi:23S rRNA pseudouridine1911/1915/1917 synthase
VTPPGDRPGAPEPPRPASSTAAGEAAAPAGDPPTAAGEGAARAGEGAARAGELVVGAAEAGRRLDEVAAEAAGVSRARAARWAGEGLVLVDGRARPKSHRLQGGERLAWTPPPPQAPPWPGAEDLPLEVRYEDDRLLVVAKPAGLVVHPGPGHPTGTLVNALLGRAGTVLSAGGEPGRPGIVHRLDKDTSGLLLVAKDDAAHLALSRDLAAHRVERRYLALVQGRLPGAAGTVDRPVGRHPRDRKRMAVVAKGGRAAVTHWRVLETFPAVQLVEATLETGRTHQVRVHLAAVRHPVVGDRTYGADPSLAARLGVDRPFLHAWRLAFRHPADGRTVELTEPLPPDLQGVLDRLGASWPVTSS